MALRIAASSAANGARVANRVPSAGRISAASRGADLPCSAEATAAPPEAEGERQEFQAEVRPRCSPALLSMVLLLSIWCVVIGAMRWQVSRLLDLIVNSLYSNKDVFLRELVSNASDALDKIRLQSVTDQSALGNVQDLGIWISSDEEAKTLTIEDSGIGMTRSELHSNLGSIASSGTAKFLEAAQNESASENLIGRFGVGFYAAFLVAHTAVVDSKHNDEDRTHRWQSTISDSSYTVGESPAALERGTRITLYLKDDCADYANSDTICNLVKTYSEFIDFPISVYSRKSESKQVKDEDATQKARESFEQRKKTAEDNGEEFNEDPPEDVMKTEYEDVWNWRVQNDIQPLWTRSPKDVSQEEYNEFFKSTFKEFLDPLTYSHFSAEGEIEFKAMLFIPGMAPFDQSDQMQGKSQNIRLYVRRVFISDQFDEDLMPRYLNFVKGVIDSSDLPLNVSREILQESRVVRVMRRRLLRKALDMIDDLAKKDDGGEAYATFWNSFGRYIKLGVIEDQDNRKQLASLLRFYSSKSEEQLVSLDEYITRMPEGSSSIYYMAADSFEAAKNAPFLEGIVKKGYEVLYLTEPIDEVCITNMGSYGEYQLVDVTKEQVDPAADDEEEKKKTEEKSKEFEQLTEWIKSTLGTDKVEDVRISNRLSDTPCVLATSQYGWSANMERIMKAQAMGDSKTMDFMRGKKIMEINPDHPIMQQLKYVVESGKTNDESAQMRVQVLYETALLNSGFQLDSPTSFANKVFNMMSAEQQEQPQNVQQSGNGSGARVPDQVVEDSSDTGQ